MMLGHTPQDGHGLGAAAVVDASLGGLAGGQGRAAGVEAAAAGDQGRVGRLAGEDLLLDVVDLGDDRQQGPGVGVAGVGQHGLGRALLDDAAQVHHGQPVGDVPGEAEVVGDDQDGQAEVADQAEQQGQDLTPDRGVEAGHGLVGDQHARLQGQCPGDHHPLALAAGQLVGIGEGELAGRLLLGGHARRRRQGQQRHQHRRGRAPPEPFGSKAPPVPTCSAGCPHARPPCGNPTTADKAD
jgi:hypothetical protein